MPARCGSQCQSAASLRQWGKSNTAALPFKAVALPPSFVKVGLEAKRSSGLLALSFGLRAECGRPLQLGSHGFGVTTEVAGSCTVWELVPKELRDGGMATAGRRTGDNAYYLKK